MTFVLKPGVHLCLGVGLIRGENHSRTQVRGRSVGEVAQKAGTCFTQFHFGEAGWTLSPMVCVGRKLACLEF